MDREQRVRERAYVIWDAEGRPDGREQEHWNRALCEIGEQEAEQAAPSNAGIRDEDQPSQAAGSEPDSATVPVTAPPAKRAAKPATRSSAKAPSKSAAEAPAKAVAKSSPAPRSSKSKPGKTPT